jgi:hypothetical protein
MAAALAVEMMSIWMSSGLALATQALGLAPPASVLGAGAKRPAVTEPDPVRP